MGDGKWVSGFPLPQSLPPRLSQDTHELPHPKFRTPTRLRKPDCSGRRPATDWNLGWVHLLEYNKVWRSSRKITAMS